MEKRKLGVSGLETIPLVLGGNVFGWTADRDASFAVLDAFVAGGGTMIDTADVYSAFAPGNKGGESETMIGEWLKRRGRRDDVLIATKVGLLAGTGGEGLAPSRIEAAVDESLARLQTDYIDLYFAHRDDPDVPILDALAVFDKLVRAGKVRAIGASNYKSSRLAEALRVSDDNGFARFTVLQPLYNMMERPAFERALQKLVIDEGLGVVPYFSLASGFLSGKYRSEADAGGKARSGFVTKYLNDRGMAVLAALDAVAGETGATQAQVALAWTMAQPGITAPIASATKVSQLEDLLGATTLRLTDAQLRRLDEASAPVEAAA